MVGLQGTKLRRGTSFDIRFLWACFSEFHDTPQFCLAGKQVRGSGLGKGEP